MDRPTFALRNLIYNVNFLLRIKVSTLKIIRPLRAVDGRVYVLNLQYMKE